MPYLSLIRDGCAWVMTKIIILGIGHISACQDDSACKDAIILLWYSC